MTRSTRLKLTCTHHSVTTNILAFHTFLSRQTNLKNTSSVLSIKQGYYKEILKGRQKENYVGNSVNFSYTFLQIWRQS